MRMHTYPTLEVEGQEFTFEADGFVPSDTPFSAWIIRTDFPNLTDTGVSIVEREALRRKEIDGAHFKRAKVKEIRISFTEKTRLEMAATTTTECEEIAHTIASAYLEDLQQAFDEYGGEDRLICEPRPAREEPAEVLERQARMARLD